MFWLENSLSQLEGVGLGRGHVRVEKRAVEGKDPKWRPVIYEREKHHCVSVRKGNHEW